MSEIKERINGAVSIMNEKDAEMVWQLIQTTFHLANAEETEPYEDELQAIAEYHNGTPDYQPNHSQDEVIRELGLSS